MTSSQPGSASVGPHPFPVHVARTGIGAPVVYLHGDDGVVLCSEWVDTLAARHEVHVPMLPGWGVTQRPPHVSSVDDLSYLALDVIESLAAGPVPVLGASVGAWLAMETAVKSTAGISALVLIAPIGVRFGARHERQFLDVYAAAPAAVRDALYGTGPRPDLGALGQEDFERLAWAQDAMARFTFTPYLHDPGLVHRLHRIDVPTLVVYGADDGLVRDAPGYARSLAAAIGPHATTAELAGCGHRVEEQAPAALAAVVEEFLVSATALRRGPVREAAR